VELYVNDWNDKRILNEYNSLQWTRRAQGAGEFLLKAPLTKKNIALLKRDRILKKSNDREIMIIDFVHPVKKDKIITCAGKSGISLLDRRVVKVDTGMHAPLISGTWSQVVLTLLMRHAIAPINPLRVLPVKYEPANGLPGDVIEKSVSWKPLGSAICRLCRQYGLGIRTIWEKDAITGKAILAVQPYPLRDTQMVFSAQWGTISNEEWILSTQDYATDAVVGGSGEFPNRHMAEVGSGFAGLELFERFFDASSEFKPEDFESAGQYDDALIQVGVDGIANSAARDEYMASQTASARFKYGDDYDLGDIVRVNSSFGFKVTRLISEVRETYGDDGDRQGVDISFAPLTIEAEE